MCLLEEVGGDGGRVHGQHVDAAVAHLDGQRGGELRHEGLGRTVHHSKRVGDVAGYRGGEDETALDVLCEHLLQEVVGHLNTGGRVALQVGQLGVQAGLVKETGHDVAGVVEHNLDINVLGGLWNKTILGKVFDQVLSQ